MNAPPHYSGHLDAAERDEFLPFIQELAALSTAVICSHYLQGAKRRHLAADGGRQPRRRSHAAPDRSAIRIGVLGEAYGMRRPEALYRWAQDWFD